MKIIISIVVVMFYAVIGCFISEMVDGEYDPLYILFWPIVIACFHSNLDCERDIGRFWLVK